MMYGGGGASAVEPRGRIVVAMTGASGAEYGVSLLRHYPGEKYLILTKDALEVLRLETTTTAEELHALATETFANDDWTAPPASGSARFDAVVIIPCSMNTLAKVAWGLSDNLITRAASVALKERRKLILVPRETPLSQVHLENMLKATQMGALVLPAMPGFYHRPKAVEDLVDFIVARVLDHLGVEHHLGKRWGQEP